MHKSYTTQKLKYQPLTRYGKFVQQMKFMKDNFCIVAQ